MTTVERPREPRAFDRVPPQDLDAEQATLGGMLLDADARRKVRALLVGPDFYRPAHETIYEAICALDDRGEPADPITTARELERRGDLARIGNASYLHTLVQAVPTAANADYYAETVRECAVRRNSIKIHEQAIEELYKGEGDLAEMCDRHESDIHAAHRNARSRATYRRLGEIVTEVIDDTDSGEDPEGVKTGFMDVDALTNGFQPGELIVVAARPAVGKSTLALDFLRSITIQQRIPAAFYSLEMGDKEIGQRAISAESRVGLHKIRGRNLTDEDWQRIGRRTGDLIEAPLFIDSSPNLTMAEIATRARELHTREGIELLVVDYLQLLESGRRRHGNRQEEVSEISRRLKLLAKELEIPIIALSQLNRGPESREDKKPMVADLRESGAVEQDADMVILIHRPDVYDKESERSGEADLIFGKCRNAPTCEITVGFQGHYSRFTDLAQYEDDYRLTLPRRELPQKPQQAPVVLPMPRALPASIVAPAGPQAAVQPPVDANPADDPSPTATGNLSSSPDPADSPLVGDERQAHDEPPAPAAPSSPGPVAAGPVQPTPAARRTEQALALMGDTITKAVKAAKGDPEKAKARLTKLAIPTVMDLFDVFRAGTRYQKGYVHQKELEGFTPGGKDGAGGWAEVWEARPRFGNPYQYQEDPRVTRLDVPCAYLSAFKCWLPLQGLVSNEDRGVHADDPSEYRPQGESKTRSGLYEIDYVHWEHDGIPHPLGNRLERERLIVPHPVLMRLIDLSSDKHGRMCEAPRIHRSWTAHATESLLEDLRVFLRDERAAAKTNGDELRDYLIKQMYAKFASTIGGSTSNNRRTRRDHVNILRSRAFMNLHMRALKAHNGGLEIVHAGGTDELHVIGDPWKVFTEGSNPGNMKIKADDDEGNADA